MFDVIVIGAGAAGLAAARDLSGAGKRICLVEARGRIGGRVCTLHFPDLPVPIELGAEFIHGEVAETFAIVDAAPLVAVELPDDHWWSEDGEWERIEDFWEEIERLRAAIRIRRDVSFAEFLRSRRGLSPRLRTLACNFVEGYHAAHADRISALALRASDEEQEQPSGNRQFRLAGGYDGVLAWLAAGLDPHRVELRLGTVVREVRWRAGEVTVDGCGRGEETLRARAALVTIPIGVWKAAAGQEGAIRFDPPLEEKARALERLEVGHVVKIVFRFRERFWERNIREADRNFVHTASRFMPTWWSAAPVRAPILTGWAGGHAAEALLAEGGEAMVDRALEAMGIAFGLPRRRLDRLFVAAHTHDWQADPFSRGAYAYAGVGAGNAHALLGRPIRGTLFFAGEATSADQTGTVAGAIASGRRAAREVVRTLGQPRRARRN